MGNSDDDSDFAEYGTALEAIEEDEVTRKRPIPVADQTAVDERGRRRFHGAFTGGFSAGYFNTVGSKEGWAPSTFKSTRGERGSFKGQNVLDYMDDEDKGAFGIAPQILRPTDDFTDKNDSRTRKRPLAKQSEGPIPGGTVLEQIIQPVKETVGIKILVKMGWRPGKGVGPKVQIKAKKRRIDRDAEIIQPEDVNSEQTDDQQMIGDGGKIYSCSLPPELMQPGSDSDGSDDLLQADELLAPDDVSSLLCNPKVNTFGLGYKGLDRNALSSTSTHVDLFGGAKLKFRMENKHLSISGEAFGTGAFEDNDEDIYSREDMSQYDFALETPEERRKRRAKEEYEKRKSKNKENCVDGFKPSSTTKLKRKNFPPPHLPRNFEPFHTTKKSRFESTGLISEQQETAAKGLSRHSLTISERQVLIEENVNKESTESNEPVEVPGSTVQPTSSDSEKVTAEQPTIAKPSQLDDDTKHRIDRLKKFTQVLQAYTSNKPSESQTAAFKPFMKNPEKQERYEKYLTLWEAGFSESLRDLQPPEMAQWERDREKMEFERASKLYKPMNSILSSRFTSAKSHDISHLEPEKEVVKEKDPKDDPQVAAKMNLFGKLTHKCIEWHPDNLVCKRFNVPNPYPDSKFVGCVRVDVSSKNSSSGSTTFGTATTKKVLDTTPKKSLFDNLDFSKPPPGLLPPGETTCAESLTGSSVEGAAKPMLAFQHELSGSAAVEVTEIVPSQAERPPLDLFKEIFADSSDESEEEDTETPLPKTSQINLGKTNQQHQPSNSEHLATPSSDKVASSKHDGKSPPPVSSVPYKRRVFDRIDLDSMQDHRLIQGKNNEDLRNSNNDDGEDEEDMYGPLPPRSTSSNNNVHSSGQDLQKPKFIPRGSSKITPPVSSSSITNSRVQSTSHYERSGTKEAEAEDVVWVEKSAVSGKSSKSRVKSKKRSSSAKKSSKKSKKDKHKSHKSEKKHKKKGSHKRKSKGKSRHESSSGSGSDDSSGAASDSSVTINDSLDNRALLAKLKQITKSKSKK